MKTIQTIIGYQTSYGKSSGNYSGADNIADAARLKEYYKQAEMAAGARHAREWDSYTGYKRDWYETLAHNGNIRQVRPDPNITDDVKVHYMFDADGNYYR